MSGIAINHYSELLAFTSYHHSIPGLLKRLFKLKPKGRPEKKVNK